MKPCVTCMNLHRQSPNTALQKLPESSHRLSPVSLWQGLPSGRGLQLPLPALLLRPQLLLVRLQVLPDGARDLLLVLGAEDARLHLRRRRRRGRGKEHSLLLSFLQIRSYTYSTGTCILSDCLAVGALLYLFLGGGGGGGGDKIPQWTPWGILHLGTLLLVDLTKPILGDLWHD